VLSTDADRGKNRGDGEEGRESKCGERAKEEGEGLLTKMAPPEGGIHVLDGSGIREGLANGNVIAKERFAQSDEGGKGHLTTAELRRAAEAEAAALLLGARIQSQILDRAFDTAVVDQGSEQEVDEQAFAAVLENYLLAIADSLDDEPLLVSVLDGTAIKMLLEDEDEFAMLAETLFTELDTDDSGKLSRNELRPAILQLGIEQGVPPAAATPEADELLTKLLTKYGQGSEELGQAQFASLLQEVLQDMADSLTQHPITVVRDARLLDGSHLLKVLADENAFLEMTELMFSELDVNKDGKLNKSEVRTMFENQGTQWGLPPGNEPAAEQVYDEVFKVIDTDQSGELDKTEFKVLAKVILENLAEELRMNPILVDIETAAR
jgi:Ca2+-binding EF-hand superfamily protein